MNAPRPRRVSPRILIAITLATTLAATAASYLTTSLQRNNKIERLAVCARFRGDDTSINADFLRGEIDTLRRAGSSWKDAYGAEAALLGCGTD